MHETTGLPRCSRQTSHIGLEQQVWKPIQVLLDNIVVSGYRLSAANFLYNLR